jgi:hypothetical protein
VPVYENIPKKAIGSSNAISACVHEEAVRKALHSGDMRDAGQWGIDI